MIAQLPELMRCAELMLEKANVRNQTLKDEPRRGIAVSVPTGEKLRSGNQCSGQDDYDKAINYVIEADKFKIHRRFTITLSFRRVS
jgi:hypothetical protein